MDINKLACPECHKTSHVQKKGLETMLGGAKKQRYKCTNCGKTFYVKEAASAPPAVKKTIRKSARRTGGKK